MLRTRNRDVQNLSVLCISIVRAAIAATGKDFRQGSEVVFELKEPWKGFLKNGDFVRGAHLQNLLKVFEWVVEDIQCSVNIALPQPKELEVEVIY